MSWYRSSCFLEYLRSGTKSLDDRVIENSNLDDTSSKG